jgi:hypothetical protein
MRSRSPSGWLDPRTVATLAIILSLVAIALEIAYTIGHFALVTFEQLG